MVEHSVKSFTDLFVPITPYGLQGKENNVTAVWITGIDGNLLRYFGQIVLEINIIARPVEYPKYCRLHPSFAILDNQRLASFDSFGESESNKKEQPAVLGLSGIKEFLINNSSQLCCGKAWC